MLKQVGADDFSQPPAEGHDLIGWFGPLLEKDAETEGARGDFECPVLERKVKDVSVKIENTLQHDLEVRVPVLWDRVGFFYRIASSL